MNLSVCLLGYQRFFYYITPAILLSLKRILDYAWIGGIHYLNLWMKNLVSSCLCRELSHQVRMTNQHSNFCKWSRQYVLIRISLWCAWWIKNLWRETLNQTMLYKQHNIWSLSHFSINTAWKKIVYANFSAFKLGVAFNCTIEAIYHVFQDEC